MLTTVLVDPTDEAKLTASCFKDVWCSRAMRSSIVKGALHHLSLYSVSDFVNIVQTIGRFGVSSASRLSRILVALMGPLSVV